MIYKHLKGDSLQQVSNSKDIDIGSPEVVFLMTVFTTAIPLSFPGVLVSSIPIPIVLQFMQRDIGSPLYVQLATTLRYEHQAESIPGGKESSITGSARRVNKTPTPLFNSAFRTYILTLVIVLGGGELFASPKVVRALRMIHSFCGTSIPMVARLVVLAKQQGVYDSFMDYSNRYV